MSGRFGKAFNPSMRKQIRKIIENIEIAWSSNPTKSASGRAFTAHSLHIILKLKNSKWKDTHLYFSDLEFKMEDIKRIEREFRNLKEFLDEEEK